MSTSAAAGSPLLDVRGLSVAYGEIVAVKGVDFNLLTGETVALIGANGAGKTTILKALIALLPARAGEISFAGESIVGVPAYRLARRGISLVPEGRGVFARLSVLENLQLGAYCRTDAAGVRADLVRMYELFPRLHERREQAAGTLSGGEQQMLALARALMNRPRLLLLDEPSMGLAPLMVQKIFKTIETIAREGVTILLVEQNAKLALQVSARAYVLENGRMILSGPAATLCANPAIRRAYLGEWIE